MSPIAIRSSTKAMIVNVVSDLKKIFFVNFCIVSGKIKNIIPFKNDSHPKIGIKINQPPFNFQ